MLSFLPLAHVLKESGELYGLDQGVTLIYAYTEDIITSLGKNNDDDSSSSYLEKCTQK